MPLDDSLVVREFLTHGGAKVNYHGIYYQEVINVVSQDRKQVMKALKPHIERMCLDDESKLTVHCTEHYRVCKFHFRIENIFLPYLFSNTNLLAKFLIFSIIASSKKS